MPSKCKFSENCAQISENYIQISENFLKVFKNFVHSLLNLRRVLFSNFPKFLCKTRIFFVGETGEGDGALEKLGQFLHQRPLA